MGRVSASTLQRLPHLRPRRLRPLTAAPHQNPAWRRRRRRRPRPFCCHCWCGCNNRESGGGEGCASVRALAVDGGDPEEQSERRGAAAHVRGPETFVGDGIAGLRGPILRFFFPAPSPNAVLGFTSCEGLEDLFAPEQDKQRQKKKSRRRRRRHWFCREPRRFFVNFFRCCCFSVFQRSPERDSSSSQGWRRRRRQRCRRGRGRRGGAANARPVLDRGADRGVRQRGRGQVHVRGGAGEAQARRRAGRRALTRDALPARDRDGSHVGGGTPHHHGAGGR
mmetsp:Transcript_21304/g.38742  ORF Transcript_21304/g.38742 Transcript_21304/m.38742 type:complete len:279 (+) Transcript_21304:657-1493(+)